MSEKDLEKEKRAKLMVGLLSMWMFATFLFLTAMYQIECAYLGVIPPFCRELSLWKVVILLGMLLTSGLYFLVGREIEKDEKKSTQHKKEASV